MAIVTNQRFITGLPVYDTFSGMDGTIVQMNLDTAATNTFAPLYVGAYFVVSFIDTTLQLFTTYGRRVTHSTGVSLVGVTLLTAEEKTALIGAGYPA